MAYEAIGFWAIHIVGLFGLLWLLYFAGVYSGWVVIEFLHWFGSQCKVKSYPVIDGIRLKKLGPTFPNGSWDRSVGLWLTWTENAPKDACNSEFLRKDPTP